MLIGCILCYTGAWTINAQQDLSLISQQSFWIRTQWIVIFRMIDFGLSDWFRALRKAACHLMGTRFPQWILALVYNQRKKCWMCACATISVPTKHSHKFITIVLVKTRWLKIWGKPSRISLSFSVVSKGPWHILNEFENPRGFKVI